MKNIARGGRAFVSLAILAVFGCAEGSTGEDEATSGPSSLTGSGGASGGGEQTGHGGDGGDDGGGHDCSLGCPQGAVDLDGDPLTGECGCEYACTPTSDDDPIDPDFIDANCDGGDGIVDACVYVSASIGAANGSGTRLDPVRTIAQGIEAARAKGLAAVCLSGELYGEAVTVASGISIYGGFDHQHAAFPFRRSASAITTVRAVGTVFFAPDVAHETHLEGLTIEALSDAIPGSSTYGVRLLGGLGTLFVRYDVIQAGSGASGAAGKHGAPHAQAKAKDGGNGGTGCQGTACGKGAAQPACVEYGGAGGDGGYDSASGSAGKPGTGGAPVGKGGSGDVCFGGGYNGGNGGSYTIAGASGQAGSGGLAIGTVAGGAYLPSNGADGKAGKNGKGGSGGGGGGGGDDAGLFCYSDKGGGGGAGGCGGLGGDHGRGGGGGGGSFAVFAAAGHAIVEHNALLTAGGGHGGKGGDGAPGQLGGKGGAGGADNDDSGRGGSGGNGSNGGAGGPGGGGAGGPSACFAFHHTAVVYEYAENACQPGPGGEGGSGGSNAAGDEGGHGADGPTGSLLPL